MPVATSQMHVAVWVDHRCHRAEDKVEEQLHILWDLSMTGITVLCISYIHPHIVSYISIQSRNNTCIINVEECTKFFDSDIKLLRLGYYLELGAGSHSYNCTIPYYLMFPAVLISPPTNVQWKPLPLLHGGFLSWEPGETYYGLPYPNISFYLQIHDVVNGSEATPRLEVVGRVSVQFEWQHI